MANPNPKEMFTDVLVHYETGIRRERERQKRERETSRCAEEER